MAPISLQRHSWWSPWAHTPCVSALSDHTSYESHPARCGPVTLASAGLRCTGSCSCPSGILFPWPVGPLPFHRDRLTFADHVNKVTQPHLFLSPPTFFFSTFSTFDHLSDTTLGWSWGAKIAGVPAPSLCLSDTRGSVNICWVRERDYWQSCREQVGLATETSEEALIVVTLKFGDSLNQGAGVEKRVRRQGG